MPFGGAGYDASAMSESSGLRARLTTEGLEPGIWSNGPGDRYGSHDHRYDKVIVVEAGSIMFGVPTGPIDLGEGDRLELLAGTAHDAVVGPRGVTCLEAHLPQGSLRATIRHEAGTW
jgi:quercetin dioxygenase-like cupin family protein